MALLLGNRTRRRATAIFAAILLLGTSLSTSSAFYIPGLSPNVFHDGERVPLYVNKIFSEKSPLPYAYADLPFVCPPPEDAKKAWLNLGEVLRGDRISTSNYEVTSPSLRIFGHPMNLADTYHI